MLAASSARAALANRWATGPEWMEDVPGMVALFDAEWRWTAANRQLLERLGYDDIAALQGRTLWDLTSASDGGRAAELVERCHDSEAVDPFELRLTNVRGEAIDFELRVAAHHHGERRLPGFCALIQDVSARKVVERELESYTHQLERLFVQLEQRTHELEEANEQIRQARLQTLAAEELTRIEHMKTSFLDVAAHELRTPVTLMRGVLAVLNSDLAPDVQQQLVSSAHRSARRLTNIVDNALKLLESGHPALVGPQEKHSLKTVLEGAASDVDAFLQLRGQQLRLRFGRGLPQIPLDRSMMRDVAVNLLMNAIKFTPDGGRIELSTATVDDGWVRFSVEDNGLGIDPRDLPHIFDRFYCSFDTRHHSSGEYEFNKRGPGFGLAIVRKFVALHGGRVEVANRPSGGAVFTVYLPT